MNWRPSDNHLLPSAPSSFCLTPELAQQRHPTPFPMGTGDRRPLAPRIATPIRVATAFPPMQHRLEHPRWRPTLLVCCSILVDSRRPSNPSESCAHRLDDSGSCPRTS